MNEPVSNVRIVGCTDCGERICAAGGRISTLSGNAEEILGKSLDPEKNASLIGKVTSSGHTSIIEHISFNLAFTDVSVLVEQFMIEFRLASFTVKSRRYVDFADAGFFIPRIEDPEGKERFLSVMKRRFDDYARLTDLGIPKEDARFVLPYCFYSNFICTLNGRELYHVLEAMLFGRGARYPEIRAIGQALLTQAQAYAPGVFGKFMEQKHPAADSVLPGLSLPQTGTSRPAAGKTELLASTPGPEELIIRTALIEAGCGAPDTVQQILADPAFRRETIAAVMRSDRPRALENAGFTFRLNALSLSGITHLVRHRMQSVQIPALDRCDPERYIIPPTVRQNADAMAIYTAAFDEARAYTRYAPEEIRAYTLLSGNTLDVVTTMNARELLLFLRLRTCNRAQWEIRDYAVEMLLTLREVAPLLFAHYGPSCCVLGYCPEGRLSCGQMQEVRRKFRAAQ